MHFHNSGKEEDKRRKGSGRAFESDFWHVLDPGSNPVGSSMARLGGFLIGIEIPLI